MGFLKPTSSDALSRFMTILTPTVRFQLRIWTTRRSFDVVIRKSNLRGMPEAPSSVMFGSVL